MRDFGLVWAVGLVLKGTALLLFVFLVAGALRRASAGLRHLVWSGGIVALLALPLVSVMLPWKLPVVATPLVTLPEPAPAHPAVEPRQSVAPADAAGRAAQTPVQLPPAVNGEAQSAGVADRVTERTAVSMWSISTGTVVSLLVGLWIVGAVLLLARLGLGGLMVRRIVRRATPLESPDWTHPLIEAADRLGLERVPRLMLSDRLPMPFACGLVGPTIVLPAGASEWSDRRRRAVLCHELAHVRRLDLPVNALGQLACAVYWFHPLVWLATRKLRMESERACDDLVLGVGTRPSEYADHLLQIVCGAARAHTPAVALPMAERREFEGRMLAILERDARRDPPARRHALTLAGFAAALLVPLAAIGPATRQAARQQSAPQRQQVAQADDTVRVRQIVERSAERAVAQQQEQSHVAVAREQQGQGPTAKDGDATVDKEAWKDAERDAERDAKQGGKEAGSEAKQDRSWKLDARQNGADPKAVEALIGALDDSVANVREDAAYALGELEAKDAVAPLTSRLGHESSAGVRKTIAWSLGQIESRDATAALSRMVQTDPSAEARAMAIWALGRVEDPAGVPALASALKDSSEEVRGRAAWAIGSIEPKAAPPELVAALKDRSAKVRVRVAWALGQIGDGAVATSVEPLLKDSVADVKKAAFWALGQMGAAAQPALIEALKDPDPDIRAAAARALAGGHTDPWPWPWPMPIVR
jgi:HEAT repeat protein/beta-lactamase regulating signal transducer with metallopeptidase domain